MRPPMPPVHLFLIDTSASAVSSGATAAACQAVAESLDALQGEDRCLAGVATFDRAIHFYSLRGDGQAQMLVVPDVNVRDPR